MLVGMGGGVAQGAKRVHRIQRHLASTGEAAVNALGFIHYENGTGCFNQVDGFLAAGLFAVLVKIVDIFFIDGADCNHHDLNLRTGGEVAHLPELR